MGGSGQVGQQAPQQEQAPQQPSVLFAPGEAVAASESEPGCFRDLNLDQLVAGVSAGFDGQLAPFFWQLLASEDSVCYRQEVFADLAVDGVRSAVEEFVRRMQVMRAHLEVVAKLRHRFQRESWFLDAALVYCDAVRAFAEGLATSAPASRAMRALASHLSEYVAAPPFRSLVEEGEGLRQELSGVGYCVQIRGLKVTVKRRGGEADYGPEVLATFEKFRQGTTKGYGAKFREDAEMNHVESQVLDRVALLFPELFGRLHSFAEAHRSFVDGVLARFDREVKFYLAYRRYLERLVSAGLPVCFPLVSASKEELVRDGYDLVLAAKLAAGGTAAVCNDFELRDGERILVVSGPNQGGKTTFARTFGQLHHLAALGCPVPAREARLLLSDSVLTHFAAEENLGQHTGKLEDDIVRVGEVLRSATARSVVVLNEVFGSTTLDDAVFLGTELMERLTELDVLCCCVTFIDELSKLDKAVSMMSSVDPADTARRTFKVTRRPADGLAFALAIAEKYGVTYGQLTRRLAAGPDRDRTAAS